MEKVIELEDDQYNVIYIYPSLLKRHSTYWMYENRTVISHPREQNRLIQVFYFGEWE